MFDLTLTPIPLAAVRTDPAIQMRCRIDPAVVRDYAAAMAAGAPFPPIALYGEGEDLWLADGHHRLEAARQAGLTEIQAEIRPGTRRDALLHAARSNTAHGLRRTAADARRAVRTLLEDKEWGQWSDREIARHCSVDHKTVSRHRRELSGEFPQMGRRARRGETIYTLQTGRIGASRRPENGEPDTPGPAVGLTEAASEGEESSGGGPPAAPAAPRADPEPARSEPEPGPQPPVPAMRKIVAALAARLARPVFVRSGEWWQLGRHRLFYGPAGCPACRARLPQAAFGWWEHLAPGTPGQAEPVPDWLLDHAPLLAVSVDVLSLAPFLRGSPRLPYVGAIPTRVDWGVPAYPEDAWLFLLFFSHRSNHRHPGLLEVAVTGHRDRRSVAAALPALALRAIELLSSPREVVIASGGGAAHALLAAEATGRSCYGAVADPSAFEDAIGRWELLTGEKARPCPPGQC